MDRGVRGKVVAPGLKVGGKCRGDGEKHQSQISNQPGAQGMPGDGLKECKLEQRHRASRSGSRAEVVRRYHKSAIHRRRTEAMRAEPKGGGDKGAKRKAVQWHGSVVEERWRHLA